MSIEIKIDKIRLKNAFRDIKLFYHSFEDSCDIVLSWENALKIL